MLLQYYSYYSTLISYPALLHFVIFLTTVTESSVWLIPDLLNKVSIPMPTRCIGLAT